ncbi:hypothetical protein ACGMNB_18370 [Shewanella oncorhynchi]|uniref:hypothetical protein n=1 Tax=Shewanella oncorhynchi TaxID=2726434 RepID=UPI003746C4D3
MNKSDKLKIRQLFKETIMGREKAKIEEAESAWDRKAQAEELRCSVCSQHIIHSERELFYEVGMCGYCNHQANKDD